MAGGLELRSQPMGSARHYLDGEPVHCGAHLEWRTESGRWVGGRYEWNPRAGGEPVLVTGSDGDGGSRAVVITSDVVLRWPAR